MTALPITHALYLASLVFLVGLGGALLQRRPAQALLSVQVMLLGATLALAAAARIWADVGAHGLALLAIVAAAGQLVVGAALTLQRRRRR